MPPKKETNWTLIGLIAKYGVALAVLCMCAGAIRKDVSDNTKFREQVAPIVIGVEKDVSANTEFRKEVAGVIVRTVVQYENISATLEKMSADLEALKKASPYISAQATLDPLNKDELWKAKHWQEAIEEEDAKPQAL